MNPAISIIIVNYNSARETIACVASLAANRGCEYEIIVVDNASQPEDRGSLDTLKDVSLVFEPENRGFGAGCNRGVEGARGTYLLFVNPDVVVRSPTTLAELTVTADGTPDLGALGCRIVFADDRPQLSAYRCYPGLVDHAWDYAPAVGSLLFLFGVRYSPSAFPVERHATDTLIAAHLLGAFLLVPRAVFDAVGGFDEGFFLYREETDLCRRIADRGLKIVYTPDPVVVHASGTSTQNRDFANFDPRYMRSTYRYFRLRHGATYVGTAWLLACAGMSLSLPYMHLLRAVKRAKGTQFADLDLLIQQLMQAIRWHARNSRAVCRPVRRALADARVGHQGRVPPARPGTGGAQATTDPSASPRGARRVG